MRQPSSISVRVDLVVVCTVAYGLCDMYRHVARFHLDLAQLWRGAPCGKARPRTVWITFGGGGGA